MFWGIKFQPLCSIGENKVFSHAFFSVLDPKNEAEAEQKLRSIIGSPAVIPRLQENTAGGFG